MKQKKVKIINSTLFIYKSTRQLNMSHPTETTDTTSTMTGTSGTTGFNK